jgi:hypothetical protein
MRGRLWRAQKSAARNRRKLEALRERRKDLKATRSAAGGGKA